MASPGSASVPNGRYAKRLAQVSGVVNGVVTKTRDGFSKRIGAVIPSRFLSSRSRRFFTVFRSNSLSVIKKSSGSVFKKTEVLFL